VYRAYSVSIDVDMRNIVYRVCKADGLQLTVYTCCSWDKVLNVGLDVSFDNMYDCKRIREEAGEVIRSLTYVTNGETAR
jgi:hypothetical protein